MDCREYCEKQMAKYSTWDKFVYLLNERDDFGCYGWRIFKPSNMAYLDKRFRSRFYWNCMKDCQRQ